MLRTGIIILIAGLLLLLGIAFYGTIEQIGMVVLVDEEVPATEVEIRNPNAGQHSATQK